MCLVFFLSPSLTSDFSFECFSLINARYIRRGKPDAGFALFESESLKWPGFVEFDDVNGKVLTYSAQDRYIFSPQCYKL